MFEGPEHASYVELCRALRLERKFEEGDFAWVDLEAPGAVGVTCISARDVAGGEPRSGMGIRWLPRLDQWLARLEEVGERSAHLVYDVRFGRSAQVVARRPIWCPTFEEAAAKLWLAVTGREAPRA